MEIIEIGQKDSIKIASEILYKGGIVIFPTDTVYGIGCVLNEKAIRKLYQIKNRPLNQPTAILINRNIYNFSYCCIKSHIDDTLKKYPKGKITVIVPAECFKIVFPKILLRENKIGFRIPDDLWLEKLIDEVGPIVASSANKKGESVPETFSEIDHDLLNIVDLVISSKQKADGHPSTVYDIEEGKIIRA